MRYRFNGPDGHQVFGKRHALRRQRAGTQYPTHEVPPITRDDAAASLEEAAAVVGAARTLFDSEGLTAFDPKAT